MTQPPVIRLLTEKDVTAYRAVRLALLRGDPHAYISTAADFVARSDTNVARQLTPTPDAVTLGAFMGQELVGILGLARESRATVRHRADIFGVGVLASYRGQGCAAALLAAALVQAQTWDGVEVINLTVIESQDAARRLYERYGFRVWGTQPDAVRHGSVSLAEHWMSLVLPPQAQD